MAILYRIRLNGRAHVVTMPTAGPPPPAGPAVDDLGVFTGTLGLTSAGPATAYTTTLSATSGTVGTPVTMTFTPTAGPWPSGEVITPTDTGVAGSFAPTAVNASGTGPVTCTFTPSAAGTASLSSTASPSMTNTTGPISYTANPVVTDATAFTVALSRASGASGQAVTMTVTPSGGPWPSGKVVTPSAAGLVGTWDNASLTGSGSNPLGFTFTPSSAPGSSGTLTADAPAMTNSSGPQAYAVNAVASSTAANRYDIVSADSAGAPASAHTITLYPNGTWPSGSITLAPSLGSGTFSPSATVTPTAGSNAAVTVSYTPSAPGEHMIRGTNTAAMHDPYGAPLNVFTGSAGTPQTLAASLRLTDWAMHQRDSASGNPAGFSFPWARGWAEVWFDITAIGGATDGLWIKLYDALSAGSSATQGSGTALNATPVQVYGAVSAAGRVRVLLPAGPYYYYAELATDAAFTNPARVAQRFGCGVIVGVFSRSQEAGIVRAYAYNAIPATGISYDKTTVAWVSDYRYPDTAVPWFRIDNVTTDPYSGHYGESATSAAEEFGRLIESQLGCLTGLAGVAATAGGLDSVVSHTGALAVSFTGTIDTLCASKFRYFWFASGNWDGSDAAYPTETFAEDRTRYMAAVDTISQSYPACAVIGWVTSTSGWFGNAGSGPLGYTRLQGVFLNELEPANPMVVSKENYHWNEFYGGHATMASRVQYARTSFRQFMAAEHAAFGGLQTSDRGPVLGASGSIAGRVISIPYTLRGGTALAALSITFTNPTFTYGTASGADLAVLFSVYPGGGVAGSGPQINLASATFRAVNATTGFIDLTLAGASGVTYSDNTTGAVPASMTAHYAADFPYSLPGGQRVCVITDDRTDTANGIPFGWHMRPKLDISIA